MATQREDLDLPKYVKQMPKWLIKLQKGKYSATTLYPFGIFFKHFDYKDIERIVNHEHIHWKQQKEMLVIPFYLWYGLEYLINIFKYGLGNQAYYNLSHEQEAYVNEKDLKYLETRKSYAWTKFIKNKPFKRSR